MRAPVTSPQVAIIGAGMSGLCMAMRLHRAGIETFTIYEKAGEVGGTWRENRYPGLSCDVPSPFYSYSFAPNPDWSSRFSGGTEIQTYSKGVAGRAGVLDRVRFDTEIVDATFDGDRWQLGSAGGEEFSADVVVAATGVLHQPRIHDIPGLETFAGAAFHSARWDESVPLDGRRIAVIGTGSTGVQIVPRSPPAPRRSCSSSAAPSGSRPSPTTPTRARGTACCTAFRA